MKTKTTNNKTTKDNSNTNAHTHSFYNMRMYNSIHQCSKIGQCVTIKGRKY